MGTVMQTPDELTIGKMLCKDSAAASALSLPPFRQSLKPNSVCLTGLEKETCRARSVHNFLNHNDELGGLTE